jgi:hypothetical protein
MTRQMAREIPMRRDASGLPSSRDLMIADENHHAAKIHASAGSQPTERLASVKWRED